MIITWLGRSPQASLEIGASFIAFKYAVPTWLPELAFKQLSADGGFQVWNKDMELPGVQTTLFVAMPNQLALFIGALFTLKKIAATHPTSQIHVLCKPEYADLIQVERCAVVRNRERTDYYREFILTTEAHPILNDRNALITTPLQLLFLSITGLAEVGKDTYEVGYILNLPKGDNICVIESELGNFAQLAGLSEELKKSNPNFIYANGRDNFTEMYLNLCKSHTVIAVGESQYTLLAAAMGRRVLIFRLPNAAQDYARQYLCYANVEVVSGANVYSLTELSARIIEKLNTTPQAETRSWERIGLDARGEEKPKPQTNTPQPRQHPGQRRSR